MKNQGFTLAELLVTVSVLAIIAGMTFPVVSNRVLSLNSKTDIEVLKNALETTQLKSRATETSLQISFYTDTPCSSRINGFQIGTLLNPENPLDPAARITMEKTFSTNPNKFYLPNNIRIIEFSPTSSVRYRDKDKNLLGYSGPFFIGIGTTTTWNIEVFYTSGQTYTKPD